MATMTTVSLAGTSLPAPAAARRRGGYRGGTLVMADASIVHDLVDTTRRHTFELEWHLITATQLNAIRTAFGAVKDTTGALTWIDGANYTVTRPEGGELEDEAVVTAGGDIKYNASLSLIEDS